MKTKKVTLADVAKLAGVGIGTASRVLNNSSSVTEETKIQVENAIKQLNYIPNNIARTLKSNSSRILGVLVSDITSTFFSTIIKGMDECLMNTDAYSLMIINTNMDQEKIERAILTLQKKNIDGLFILGETINDNSFHSLLDLKIPVMAVSSKYPINDRHLPRYFGNVLIDNELAAAEAVGYLCDKGHTRIAFLTSDIHDVNVGKDRFNGYCSALKSRGLKIDKDLIISGELSFSFGYQSTLKLINDGNLPTAIFATSDTVAIGSLRALLESNINVPADVSIMGFDGIDEINYTYPSISTVYQPRYEMGKKAMSVMLNMLTDKEPYKTPVILEHKLIITESTK